MSLLNKKQSCVLIWMFSKKAEPVKDTWLFLCVEKMVYPIWIIT